VPSPNFGPAFLAAPPSATRRTAGSPSTAPGLAIARLLIFGSAALINAAIYRSPCASGVPAKRSEAGTARGRERRPRHPEAQACVACAAGVCLHASQSPIWKRGSYF
jgi:hypothetical protein